MVTVKLARGAVRTYRDFPAIILMIVVVVTVEGITPDAIQAVNALDE